MSIDMQEIEQELLAIPEELPEERPIFEITDEPTAEWVVSKLAMWKGEIARRKEAAAAYVADAQRNLDYLNWRFNHDLAIYTTNALKTEKKKSIKLASGTLGFRVQKPKIVVDDEGVVMRWADDNCPDAIKKVESILKTPLNDHFKATGELPDGCSLTEESQAFYVK